jgi:hypothetical protein
MGSKRQIEEWAAEWKLRVALHRMRGVSTVSRVKITSFEKGSTQYNVLRNRVTSYQAMDRVALHMVMHVARPHSLIKITFGLNAGRANGDFAARAHY